MNRPAGYRNSYYSSKPSEARFDDFYPFKYDDNLELSNDINSQPGAEATLRIGSKIDEVFDVYMEDSLFRIFYSQPLKYSPLTLKLSSKPKSHVSIMPKGFISYTLFGPHSSNRSNLLLQLQKILYNESLIDAGIYTPADFIVDPENSHRFNRRAVYESAHLLKELASIKSGRMRAIWRYFCHFTVYFIKGIFAGFGMYTTNRFLIPYFNKHF